MSLGVTVKTAFKGFALDVDFSTCGEMLGILGASGCGKSMTLKCVAGIQTPDEGRVVCGDKVLFDSATGVNVRPQQRRVGYLFQSYALFPHMRVEENIGCGVMGVDRAEKGRRITEQIRRFRLEGLERRYPGQLSGGQQQRVALARILASEPEVLLLDEPFSALDSHLKEQVQLELMDLLHDYGGDVLMVTHSRDEAYRLCGNLLVMDGGRCIASGNTRALFQNPGLLTVARLTGCKNFSRARQNGPDTVFAEDWGLTLRVNGPIPRYMDHVGVRAHHFHAGQGPNRFPVTVHKELESPFEWNLLVTAPEIREGASIWWKVAKEAYGGPPNALFVDPEHILLLRSSD